ncbi:MAG TPA: thioredoxin domain-containing protein, partial [Dehalococcoidia bacterium]|nr:thioredoxin domain-containing protein [Dehalococcoidia bacterium]
PHFEKMLYDNALLARVYLDAYKVTGDAFYRRITEETLDYVLREMTDPSGGFYSTQDADSEGEEGKFFLWTPAELAEVLGAKDAATAGAYFGVTEAGNFEGSNILHVRRPADEALQARLPTMKAQLYEARERRVHPARDEKVLTAWNGLMQRAFAEAAIAFDSETFRDAARRNADFLLGEMRPNGRLLRTWKQGVARINGYLEDYACLIDALLATYSATFNLEYLQSAISLAREMLELFWDDEIKGFFDTGKDHETLVTRPRDFFDNATPSGTSVAVDVLLRLSVLTDDNDFEERATTCLRTLSPFVEQAPTAFGRLLGALEFYLARSQELALIWPNNPREADAMLGPVRLLYAPNLILVGAPEGEGAEVTPLLQDRPATNGLPTAYVCERYVCQAPTTNAEELLGQLKTLMP